MRFEIGMTAIAVLLGVLCIWLINETAEHTATLWNKCNPDAPVTKWEVMVTDIKVTHCNAKPKDLRPKIPDCGLSTWNEITGECDNE